MRATKYCGPTGEADVCCLSPAALCDHLKADLVIARQRQATLTNTLIESALEAA